MFGKIGEFKDGVAGKYRSRVRERAITQAKARIALSERNFDDFSEDELEIIVKDEEEKVKRSIKQTAVVAVLVTLGLS
jgi:bacterioferritin (cytochrome b1)